MSKNYDPYLIVARSDNQTHPDLIHVNGEQQAIAHREKYIKSGYYVEIEIFQQKPELYWSKEDSNG